MDIMVTSPKTFPNLIEHAGKPSYFASGVREHPNLGDTHQILHALGCMRKASVLEESVGSFLPNFPYFDVGEKLSAQASQLSLEFHALRPICDVKNNAVTEHIGPLFVNRCDAGFDAEDNLLFLHVGIGIRKTSNFLGSTDPLSKWREAFEEYAERKQIAVQINP